MEARKGGTVGPPPSASSAALAEEVVVVIAEEVVVVVAEEVEEVEERASADRRCSCRKTASAASGLRWYRNAYIVLVYISSSSWPLY